MPKKFTGENTKATAALQKKTAAKQAAVAKKKTEIEDALWKDDNKQVVKKHQKKEEQVRKKKHVHDRKVETKALLEKELETIKKPSKVVDGPQKVTRAQIQAISPQVKKETNKPAKLYHLEENFNRAMVENEVARNITEAIAILEKKSETVDKHPEKRMKAAFTAYEERRLNELKPVHPTLRLSQLKQIIYKEWLKSPENPLRKA